MDTATCPRCKQNVNSQAVTCPYCRTPLKAYGHPGIPLHRAQGDDYLCETCTYHLDDTCNYSKRPHATECTLYQNEAERNLELQEKNQKPDLNTSVNNWIRRNQSLLLIFGLLLICLLLVLSRS
ncbi:hypothetical protein Riv7116_3530 [Rivularia sp. PCC 7116]|uniref:zinc ribbon domain-containing protein n=1 Tax=Rivularia sp. PCC 7116 TaxID=373994 RepID=UPI00029F34C5|nr:zinc ribbon domain-containing protein [Rivularia sp. PCC 7116]AFY55982.1 hypothetical protein Riv7116_3530 [Rivularia sp. PCC 7116]